MIQAKQYILKKSKQIVYPVGTEMSQGYSSVVVPFTEAELAHENAIKWGRFRRKDIY